MAQFITRQFLWIYCIYAISFFLLRSDIREPLEQYYMHKFNLSAYETISYVSAARYNIVLVVGLIASLSFFVSLRVFNAPEHKERWTGTLAWIFLCLSGLDIILTLIFG